MSTRCNVAILLREQDRNKDLNSTWDGYHSVNPDGAKYISIYIHNDGYPEGVGKDLIEMFDDATYEEALRYILEGDRSTTNLSYHAWRNEPWNVVKPCPMDEPVVYESYLYCLVEQPDGKIKVFIFNEDIGEFELF